MAGNFPIFVALGGLLCPSIPVRNSDQPVGIVQKLRELGTVHSCHYLNPERFQGALRVRRSGQNTLNSKVQVAKDVHALSRVLESYSLSVGSGSSAWPS